MKRIKQVISVIIVMAMVLFGIYELGYIVRPVTTDGAYEQIETFHSIPRNSVEVTIYGSSHAWQGVNPIELYRKYGIGAYNYAWNWQKINTIKLFLQDTFPDQNPKVALIETVTVDTVLQDTNVIPEVFFCRYIKNKSARKAFMKQCLGESPTLERRLSYVMPLAMFHDNWSSLSQRSFTGLHSGASEILLKYMGCSSSEAITEVAIASYQPETQQELPRESLQELEEIVQICKDHHTEAVFFYLPWEGDYPYSDAMEQFAALHDCTFLDLSKSIQEIGLDGKTDYSDAGHLNDSGAAKATDYIGQYLATHYDLTDYRKVDNNLWEQAIAMELPEQSDQSVSEKTE